MVVGFQEIVQLTPGQIVRRNPSSPNLLLNLFRLAGRN